MKFFKKSLLLLLTFSIFCSTLSPLGSMKVYAEEGTTTNEDWSYNEVKQTLTIYKDILCEADYDTAPWDSENYNIQHVIIEDTVNKLEYAFYGDDLYSITIKNKNIDMKKAFCNARCNMIIFPEDVTSNIKYGWTDDIANVTVSSEKEFAGYLPSYENANNNLRPYIVTNLGTDFTENGEDGGLYRNYNSNADNWYIWDDNNNENFVIIPNQTRETAIALSHALYSTNDCEEDYLYSKNIVYKMESNQKAPTELEVGTKITFNDYNFTVYNVGDYSNYDPNKAASYWNESIQDWVPLWDNTKTKNVRNLEDYLLASNPDLEKYETENGTRYVILSDYFIPQGNYFLDSYEDEYFLGKTVLNDDGTNSYYYTYNNVDWIEISNFTSWDDLEENTIYANDAGEIYPIYCIDEYELVENKYNWECSSKLTLEAYKK